MSETLAVPKDAAAPLHGAAAYRLRNAVYLNVTSRCTLRCRFCPKFHGLWSVHEIPLRLTLKNEPSVSTLTQAAWAQGPTDEYVFCGLGEPTKRLAVVLATASALKAGGQRIRLNTDGLASLIHGHDVLPDLAGLIDHVSISMNAHCESIYNHLCRPKVSGSFAAMLAFAARAQVFIPKVTLTAVEGLGGVDIKGCAALARRIGVEFRSRPLEATGGRTFRIR